METLKMISKKKNAFSTLYGLQKVVNYTKKKKNIINKQNPAKGVIQEQKKKGK